MSYVPFASDNEDVALVNYAAKQHAWDAYRDVSKAVVVKKIPDPLKANQRVGYTYLLQVNNGLRVDGDFGPQCRTALSEKGLLEVDWQPVESSGGKAIGLTDEDYQKAASMLRVPQSRIRAVVEVESAGGGFNANGTVKILFEGHLFWYYLRQFGRDASEVHRQRPDLCFPKWTKKFYKGGTAEYQRRADAAKFHHEAAFCSCSYGLFQVVAGFHHRSMGYSSAVEMAETYAKSGEGRQLTDWIKLCEKQTWARLLREWNVEAFVRAYNGPGQVAAYSKRIRQAERRWRSSNT